MIYKQLPLRPLQRHIIAVLFIIALMAVSMRARAQETKVSFQIIGTDTSLFINHKFNDDTVKVLSFCCVNFKIGKLKWLHLYGVAQYGSYFTFGNQLYFYSYYLLPDRKTRCPYNVIYSIIK